MKKLIFGSLFCIFMTNVSWCSNDTSAYYRSNERTKTAENYVQPGTAYRNYDCRMDQKVISFLEDKKIDPDVRGVVRDCLFNYVDKIYNGRQPENTFIITRYNVLPIIIAENTQKILKNTFENILYHIISCSVNKVDQLSFLFKVEDFWIYNYTLCRVAVSDRSTAGPNGTSKLHAENSNIIQKCALPTLLRNDLYLEMLQKNCLGEFGVNVFNTISSVLSEMAMQNKFFVIEPITMTLDTVSCGCESPIGASMDYTSERASESSPDNNCAVQITKNSETVAAQNNDAEVPTQVFLQFYKSLCTKIDDVKKNIEERLDQESSIKASPIDDNYCALCLPQQ